MTPSAGSSSDTLYCYDPLFLEHDLPGHPENRKRLEEIMDVLANAGILSRMHSLQPAPLDDQMLARVHDASYVARVRGVSDRGGGFLDGDTYVTEQSYDVARLAAGGVAGLTRAVLGGIARNGFALVRPPGHHATVSRGMGFCLFNNVCVAAQVALDEFGLERVLILDWDVHHGNGTQDIFYDSQNVLFFSTHQSPHYPGTGHWRDVGQGDGRGFTVNVPLPPGVGDEGFARLTTDLLLPIAERYQPQLILVSAGYDGHWDDPLAALGLSLSGYWHLAKAAVGLADMLCDGRLVVTLEGGYHLTALAHGVVETCRALLGDNAAGVDPLGRYPYEERPVDELIEVIAALHGV